MLMPDRVRELLIDSGLGVIGETRADDGVDVRVTVPADLLPTPRPGGPELDLALRVVVRSRPPRPSEVGSLVRRVTGTAPESPAADPLGVLLVCPSATAGLRRHAVEAGVSLIALNRDASAGPDGHLVLASGQVLPLGVCRSLPPSRPAPRSWARWQVVRAVAVGAGTTQAELASAAGVTQARVSQLLSEAVRARLLERVSPPVLTRVDRPAARSWRVADWGRLLRWWRETYPGPGGVATHWYGLDPLVEQVDAVLDTLTRPSRTEKDHPRASGDVAADLFAPWGRPRRGVVYTRRGADLGAAGLTPCPAAEATLTLVVPQDPGVLMPLTGGPGTLLTSLGRSRWPLADPLQILADVAGSPSPDADQMADHVERWLLSRAESARSE